MRDVLKVWCSMKIISLKRRRRRLCCIAWMPVLSFKWLLSRFYDSSMSPAVSLQTLQVHYTPCVLYLHLLPFLLSLSASTFFSFVSLRYYTSAKLKLKAHCVCLLFLKTIKKCIKNSNRNTSVAQIVEHNLIA